MVLSDRGRAIFLVLLAPFVAELVSGSTPPQVWILPPVVLVFAAIYGVGALAIRELAIRWRGGAASVLLLGVAFGIVNEGMAAHSFFDPNWPGIGVLTSYGRWIGVSWLWMEWIVAFHAVYSISFPIVIVGEIWPADRERRLVSDRQLAALVPVPFAVALLSGWIVGNYPLTAVDLVAMFAAVGALGLLAYRLGPRLSALRPTGTWRATPGLAATFGFLFFVVGQVGTWQLPAYVPSPAAGFALLGAAYLLFAIAAMSIPSGPDGRAARLAWTIGGIGFYVALSPISEFALGRIALVPIDVVFLALLVRLYLRRFPRADPVPPGALGRPAPP